MSWCWPRRHRRRIVHWSSTCLRSSTRPSWSSLSLSLSRWPRKSSRTRSSSSAWPYHRSTHKSSRSLTPSLLTSSWGRSTRPLTCKKQGITTSIATIAWGRTTSHLTNTIAITAITITTSSTWSTTSTSKSSRTDSSKQWHRSTSTNKAQSKWWLGGRMTSSRHRSKSYRRARPRRSCTKTHHNFDYNRVILKKHWIVTRQLSRLRTMSKRSKVGLLVACLSCRLATLVATEITLLSCHKK